MELNQCKIGQLVVVTHNPSDIGWIVGFCRPPGDANTVAPIITFVGTWNDARQCDGWSPRTEWMYARWIQPYRDNEIGDE